MPAPPAYQDAASNAHGAADGGYDRRPRGGSGYTVPKLICPPLSISGTMFMSCPSGQLAPWPDASAVLAHLAVRPSSRSVDLHDGRDPDLTAGETGPHLVGPVWASGPLAPHGARGKIEF